MNKTFELALTFLRTGQNDMVLPFFFFVVRSMVLKYPDVIFSKRTDYCQELCLVVCVGVGVGVGK